MKHQETNKFDRGVPNCGLFKFMTNSIYDLRSHIVGSLGTSVVYHTFIVGIKFNHSFTKYKATPALKVLEILNC